MSFAICYLLGYVQGISCRSQDISTEEFLKTEAQPPL